MGTDVGAESPGDNRSGSSNVATGFWRDIGAGSSRATGVRIGACNVATISVCRPNIGSAIVADTGACERVGQALCGRSVTAPATHVSDLSGDVVDVVASTTTALRDCTTGGSSTLLGAAFFCLESDGGGDTGAAGSAAGSEAWNAIVWAFGETSGALTGAFAWLKGIDSRGVAISDRGSDATNGTPTSICFQGNECRELGTSDSEVDAANPVMGGATVATSGVSATAFMCNKGGNSREVGPSDRGVDKTHGVSATSSVWIDGNGCGKAETSAADVNDAVGA